MDKKRLSLASQEAHAAALQYARVAQESSFSAFLSKELNELHRRLSEEADRENASLREEVALLRARRDSVRSDDSDGPPQHSPHRDMSQASQISAFIASTSEMLEAYQKGARSSSAEPSLPFSGRRSTRSATSPCMPQRHLAGRASITSVGNGAKHGNMFLFNAIGQSAAQSPHGIAMAPVQEAAEDDLSPSDQSPDKLNDSAALRPQAADLPGRVTPTCLVVPQPRQSSASSHRSASIRSVDFGEEVTHTIASDDEAENDPDSPKTAADVPPGRDESGWSFAPSSFSDENAMVQPPNRLNAPGRKNSDEDNNFAVLPLWLESRKESRKTMTRRPDETQMTLGAMSIRAGLHKTLSRTLSRGFQRMRSKDALNASRMKVLKLRRRLMIYPSWKIHIIWLMCSLLCLIFDVFTIPLAIFTSLSMPWVVALEWGVRVFWSCDFVKMFTTAFVNTDGTVVSDPNKVAKQYAKTWLCLDVTCVLCDWITVIVSKDAASGLLTLAQYLRVVRLARLAKVRDIERFVNELIYASSWSESIRLVISIVKSMMLLITILHLLACFWFGIGNVGEGENWLLDAGLHSVPWWDQYWHSLHWSVGQFFGENIFMPQNLYERAIAVTVGILEILFSTLFVSTMTTSMTQYQIMHNDKQKQFRTLRHFLTQNNISSSLAVRILRNTEHGLQQQTRDASETHVELLTMLSEPLRVEMRFEIFYPVLEAHPFFAAYEIINPASMRKVCHDAVTRVRLNLGDTVFSEFESPAWPRMFFVVSGMLEYLVDTEHAGILSTHVEPGQWACEAVLWTRWMHCGTLRAIQDSVLQQLDAEAFQRVLRLHTCSHAKFYAKAFVHHLNSANEVTDLHMEKEMAICTEVFNEKTMEQLRQKAPFVWKAAIAGGFQRLRTVGALG